MNFDHYNTEGFFDEVFAAPGVPHDCARPLVEAVSNLPEGELLTQQKASERAMLSMGITFNVYSDGLGEDRTIPFDVIPRTVDGRVWDRVEAGLRQRVRAINLFIDDIYHDRRILQDGVIPEWVMETSAGFLPPCVGMDPPGGVWAHVTGSDLVRDHKGEFYVLEDNLRVPSGASYVLLNRMLMKRNFPEVWMPGGGWRGFDPTHGLAVADRHIPLAASADPLKAAPVSGGFFSNEAKAGLPEHHIQIRID